MNYFTAIVAFPLFIAIFLGEAFLVNKGWSQVQKHHKCLVTSLLIVSFLQMVSCWFWLFGFIFSETGTATTTGTGTNATVTIEYKVGLESFLSEAMGDGTGDQPYERMNCVGLVGAEVLLAVFQWIFTTITVFQAMTMKAVSEAQFKRVTGPTGVGNTITWATSFVMFCYIPICWITAYNRRCPHKAFSFPLQHHFYPIPLIVDLIFSLVMNFYCKMIANMVHNARSGGGTNTAAQQTQDFDAAADEKPENGGSSKKNAGKNAVLVIQYFFNVISKLTLVACMFAVGIFIIQFMALEPGNPLAMVACVFCVLMYTFYALRRVPMVMLYTRFKPFKDWLAKKVKTKLQKDYEKRNSNPNLSPSATSKVTPKSGV